MNKNLKLKIIKYTNKIENEVKSLFKNILNLDNLDISKNANNEIVSNYFNYCISKSNFKYVMINEIKEVVGLIFANIECKKKVNTKSFQTFKTASSQHEKDNFQLQYDIMDACEKYVPTNGNNTELVSLAVNKKYQNNGIAKRLINYLCEELIMRNIEKFFVFTDSNCNFKWYEKNGFNLQEVIKLDFSTLITLTKEFCDLELMLFTMESCKKWRNDYLKLLK